MFRIPEYGFSFTNDIKLTLLEENKLASNIREACFYLAEHTKTFPDNQAVIIFSYFAGHKIGTIYSDSIRTYFGVYDTTTRKLSLHINISEFYPQAYWFLNFYYKCENTIKKIQTLGIDNVTVPSELYNAWQECFLVTEQVLESNVPCRNYEVSINSRPQFLEVEEPQFNLTFKR